MISILEPILGKEIRTEDIPNFITAMRVMKAAGKYLGADKVESFRAAVTEAGANIEAISAVYNEITSAGSKDEMLDRVIIGLCIAKSKGDDEFTRCTQAFEEWMQRTGELAIKYKDEINTAMTISDQQIEKIDVFMQKREELKPAE